MAEFVRTSVTFPTKGAAGAPVTSEAGRTVFVRLFCDTCSTLLLQTKVPTCVATAHVVTDKGARMNKSTKGAVAAAAAGVLLLGGAGSLAFWTGSSSVPASTITAGELKLGAANCAGWTFVNAGGAAFDPATDRVVPGDSVTRLCTIPITAIGKNLSANLTLPTANITKTPTDANFTASATYKVGTAPGTAASKTTITSADNAANVYATITVTFPYGTDSTTNAQNGNGTQKATAALDALAVVATQVAPA